MTQTTTWHCTEFSFAVRAASRRSRGFGGFVETDYKHVVDDWPYDVRKDGTHRYTVETTFGMIERIKEFSTRDNVKAMMSLGDAWKHAFNDQVREVHPQYKLQREGIEVRYDRALSVTYYENCPIRLGCTCHTHIRVGHDLDHEEWTLLNHMSNLHEANDRSKTRIAKRRYGEV